jgi:hypothetical protein
MQSMQNMQYISLVSMCKTVPIFVRLYLDLSLYLVRLYLDLSRLYLDLSKIYQYFWRFSTTGTGKAASKLHLGISMQMVIHTKFAFSRLEQYGYCL